MTKAIKWMLCAAAASAAVLPTFGADDDEKGEDTRPYVSINQEDIVIMESDQVLMKKARE